MSSIRREVLLNLPCSPLEEPASKSLADRDLPSSSLCLVFPDTMGGIM